MIYRFGEFELDGDAFELRREGALLESEPKVLELLLYLVRHAERLVSREELLAEVWRGVHVEETSLYRAVAIARRLVGQSDGADAPIRTVRGRGYRFAAEVSTVGVPLATDPRAAELPGRAEALASLAAALDRARAGERQLVVVSGEAGLGKTRLVETFLASLRGGDVVTTTGQCLAPFDGGEPWSPLLEALARLCRRAGDRAVEALRTRAPAWLAQLPGHAEPAARALFESRARGATRERLTEELADALDEIASQRPLVLVLEDLQACDRATLWLLAALAQRREAAALLVIGTARTGDPATAAEPLWKLVAELKARGRCSELALHPLAEADVAAIVRARAGAEPDRPWARWLAQRSAGNPLYLNALLDSAASPGERDDVPESLAERIERQIDALDPQAARLLEAASAAGPEFSAAEAAAALGGELVAVEEACDELARRALFLTRSGVGEWPDGTLAARFRFRHALHREVLAARAAPARRREQHRRLAERLEQGFAGRTGELGAALADHCERGGDPAGALRHYAVAVEAAARRHAGHEARALAERALALVPRVPEAEAATAELAVRFALLPVLPEAIGFDHPDVEVNLARAQALCEVRGDGERRLAVLWSRCYARFQAGAADEAVAVAEELLRSARSLARPAFELLAHDALAFSHHKACRIETSLAHAERVLATTIPRSTRISPSGSGRTSPSTPRSRAPSISGTWDARPRRSGGSRRRWRARARPATASAWSSPSATRRCSSSARRTRRARERSPRKRSCGRRRSVCRAIARSRSSCARLRCPRRKAVSPR